MASDLAVRGACDGAKRRGILLAATAHLGRDGCNEHADADEPDRPSARAAPVMNATFPSSKPICLVSAS